MGGKRLISAKLSIFRHDKLGKMVYDAGETAPMKSTGFLRLPGKAVQETGETL